MVEVIRQGKGSFRVTCGSCDSDLQYSRAEVETYSKMDYTGSSDTYRRIKCPVCAEFVYVDYR